MSRQCRSSSVSRIATRVLLWYARHVPHHKGKQRLSDYLRGVFGVELEGETVERRGGFWWCLDPGDYICQDVYWSGAKDRAEIREALRSMRRGSVMLDVGANFGYYSVVIAARFGQQCTIHAFEPNPLIFARLHKNLKLNGAAAVVPHQVGLSDQEGTAAIVDVPGHSGAVYLRPGSGVAVTSLDLFVRRQGLEDVDLIKIDAEGAELRILRGARGILERFRPNILIELNAPTLERENSSISEVIALLRSLGYRIFSINPRREILADSNRLPRAVMNVLCTVKPR